MSSSSGDPRMNIGPILCGGCGRYHAPGVPCTGQLVGHSEFTPYRVPDAVEVPPEIRWHNPTPIEQKLDRIIELLEALVSRRNSGE